MQPLYRGFVLAMSALAALSTSAAGTAGPVRGSGPTPFASCVGPAGGG